MLRACIILEVEKLTNNINEINFTTTNSNQFYHQAKMVYELFEEQAKEKPNKIAVKSKEGELTYKELNEKCNQLARKIHSLGIKGNEFIAILAERKISTIIGLLGILKAGAAYIPIDPNLPMERVEYILRDAKSKLIMINSDTIVIPNIMIDILNLSDEDIFSGSKDNLKNDRSSRDLAYLIYTSGTTGTPKGVMIEHRGINRLVKNTNYVDFTNIDMLQISSISFDASTFELWGALVNGGSIYIADKEILSDVTLFKETLKQNKINTMLITPALFNQFIDEDEGVFDSLNQLLIGGDALSEKHVNILLNHNDKIKVYNVYGPTETTVIATYYKIHEKKFENKIPIGKPISNTTVYILNGEQLCGVGEQGELCVGGSGVARGYLNDEALTKKKFIENPYCEGEIIYRTGDLVRWLEDGDIEFLGRIDTQVKLRGFRIELGEVESKLKEIEGIKDAKVILKDKDGSSYLCAYVISETELWIEAIKYELQKKLPEYMIPTHILQIEKFVLTNNGKIDVSSLPAVDVTIKKEYVAARSETEKVLVEVFKEVFNVAEVGIYDNFFELGGDSIKAIRIISKLREKGYETTVEAMMQNKNAGAIALKIKKAKFDFSEQSEVTGVVHLTPIQDEFFKKNFTNPNNFNQIVLLACIETIDVGFLRQALMEIVKHHDMLRAVYNDCEQKILSIQQSRLFELMYLDYASIKDTLKLQETIENQSNEIQKNIDLSKGPLLKVAVYHTEFKDYIFVCIHHLVVDGISYRILIEDLNVAYDLIKKGKEVTLPAKSMSFKKWSKAIRRYANSYLLKREIPYWIKVESQIAESRIRGQPSNETGIGLSQLTLTESATVQLLYSAGRRYNTEINELLITVLARAIHKLTGQSSVSVNMEGHGREPLDGYQAVDRTIGWFTSIYPIVVNSVGESIHEDICHIKELFRKIPNRGVGYSILKAFCSGTFKGIEPDILFNYMGEFDGNSNTDYFLIDTAPHEKNISTGDRFGPGLIIDSEIINKCLTFRFNHNKNRFSTKFIKNLSLKLKEQFKEVIEHCLKASVITYTKSDFGEHDWHDDEFLEEMKRYEAKGCKMERIFPLTNTQEGMLYHKLQDGKSTVYVVQSIYQIKTLLNIRLLRESYELLVFKHEVLRIRISYKQVSEPRQVVLNGKVTEFKSIDFSKEIERKKEFEKFVRKDVKRGFDLQEDSLIRVIIIKLSEEDYRLVVTFHHIIMDGWCLSIIMNDLFEFYEQLITGEPKASIQNSIQKNASYEEYVRLIHNKNKEEGLNYWNVYLEEYESFAGIKTDTEPTIDDKVEDEASVVETYLTKKHCDKLEQICRFYGVTLNTIIEFTWGLLLQRYNFTTDVVFGKVVSGRDVEVSGIENMVGLFINIIPTRVKAKPTETFIKVISLLQEQALKSFNYDYCALTEIRSGDVMAKEMIKTIISFENYDTKKNESSGRISIVLSSLREQTSYALAVDVLKQDKLTFKFMYDTRKLKRKEVTRVAKQVINILEDIASKPDLEAIEIQQIQMLCEEEKERVIKEFNQTQVAYPKDKTIVELFEEQVKEKPNEIAVKSKEGELTYKELNENCNQLARKLHLLGVEANDYVALLAERKLSTIIGILGILKAGAAYVPIDPSLPSERLEYIIRDAESKVLVISSDPLVKLSLSIDILNLSDQATFSESKDHLVNHGTSRDLAYLIYTSGTTGMPKGVMIEHRSINRLVKNTNYVDFTEVNILQAGSISFDASTFELWGALLNGGSVYVADQETLSDIILFKDTLKQNKINTMFMTTALFNQFISLDEGVFDSLTQLFVGGETVSENHMKILLDHNNQIKFHHVYGPTEVTTFSTSYPIHERRFKYKIPIGKPISNTTAYILNGQQLCGIGVQGELCIGGPGVARGYLNDEALTKKKFIKNPYCEGEIIYRTGDLVRWLEDGNIEFLGRIDTQVKLRGFRIELGEVESKLKKIEGIKDAKVILKNKEGGKYLCAYMISETELLIETVKHELQKRLPEYMIPTHFSQIEKFVLTNNGKIDVSNLPEINVTVAKEYVAARNELEEALIEVFKEVLDVSEIGIHSSFVELGGDSIKAIRMVSKLREKLKSHEISQSSSLQKSGYSMTVSQIFYDQTVERLANRLNERLLNVPLVNKSSMIEVQAKYFLPNNGFPLAAVQKRFLKRKLKNRNMFNVPYIALLKKYISKTALNMAIQILVDKHRALRLAFSEYEHSWYQYEQELNLQDIITYVDLKEGSKNHDDDISTYCSNLQNEFNILSIPLWKMVLFNHYCGEKKQVLVLLFHHLIFDGISMNIFLEDLKRLLLTDINIEGLEIEKSSSYRDWCLTLNHYVAAGISEKSFNYWQDVVGDGNSLLIDKASDQRPTHRDMVTVTFNLLEGQESVSDLKKLAIKYKATPFCILLTALYRSCFELKNQSDLLLHLMSHQRESYFTNISIYRTIGFFAGAYPIRLNVKNQALMDEFELLIKHVKQTLHNIPDQGLDYLSLQYVTSDFYQEKPPLVDNSHMLFHYQSDQTVWQTDDLYEPLDIPFGTTSDRNNISAYLLNITATLTADKLNLTCYYSSLHYERHTISKLISLFSEHLHTYIYDNKI